MTSLGQFPQFKFYIDSNTDIDDVVFVLRNHIGCSIEDIGWERNDAVELDLRRTQKKKLTFILFWQIRHRGNGFAEARGAR